MNTRRQEFISDFLGALGASRIEYTQVADNVIEGVAVYDPEDPEEKQHFIWRDNDKESPSPAACAIVRILHRDCLLDVDKLRIADEDLYFRLEGNFSKEEFNQGMNELLSITVPMVDDGVETDAFFIHE